MLSFPKQIVARERYMLTYKKPIKLIYSPISNVQSVVVYIYTVDVWLEEKQTSPVCA